MLLLLKSVHYPSLPSPPQHSRHSNHPYHYHLYPKHVMDRSHYTNSCCSVCILQSIGSYCKKLHHMYGMSFLGCILHILPGGHNHHISPTPCRYGTKSNCTSGILGHVYEFRNYSDLAPDGEVYGKLCKARNLFRHNHDTFSRNNNYHIFCGHIQNTLRNVSHDISSTLHYHHSDPHKTKYGKLRSVPFSDNLDNAPSHIVHKFQQINSHFHLDIQNSNASCRLSKYSAALIHFLDRKDLHKSWAQICQCI
mmetsp:Transcript_25173/g.42764  ORF Transcript_25173/g.42764 Transcript_25173/m.42764 type:complete len:251 (+) Transcript_25173:261-1013(+)